MGEVRPAARLFYKTETLSLALFLASDASNAVAGRTFPA